MLTTNTKLRKYVAEFGATFEVRGAGKTEELYCKPCRNFVTCERKSQLTQHVKTDVHGKRTKEYEDIASAKQSKVDAMVDNSSKLESKKSEYASDLCRMLVCADIPMYKVRHPIVKEVHK